MKIGLIGGTGFEDLNEVQVLEQKSVDTEYGAPSSDIKVAQWLGAGGKAQHELFFLSRHGFDHTIPPHRVNYRANISAFKSLGCEAVIAIYAVGGIHPEMRQSTHVVIPDQIIDYTSGRIASFWDTAGPMLHVDFTEPYTARLREALITSAQQVQEAVSVAATYACTNGPRLESAAEIRRIQQDGGDIVGMTGMPEAGLAREAELAFAALCLVVNPAAGFADGPIDDDMINAAISQGRGRVFRIISDFLAST
jgi:5'-deoxy-5'-methylthioadenosine phosphorylase